MDNLPGFRPGLMSPDAVLRQTQSLPDVRPGQTWADNDKRAAGRKVHVDKIDGLYAICTIVADRADPAPHRGRYNTPRPPGWSPVGQVTRILVGRFRPTSNGYRLIEDAPRPHAALDAWVAQWGAP
jgi:hypothetical protein